MYVYNHTDEQKNPDDIVPIDNSDSSEYDDEDYVDVEESESESDYESDEESDEDEEEEKDDEEEEDEEEEYDEEEELHQFYRQQALEFEQVVNEEDDTDVLSDTETVILPLSPPQLRRERPEDYLTPESVRETVTPRAPRADRSSVVLRDLTNIVPRRLAFN